MNIQENIVKASMPCRANHSRNNPFVSIWTPNNHEILRHPTVPPGFQPLPSNFFLSGARPDPAAAQVYNVNNLFTRAGQYMLRPQYNRDIGINEIIKSVKPYSLWNFPDILTFKVQQQQEQATNPEIHVNTENENGFSSYRCYGDDIFPLDTTFINLCKEHRLKYLKKNGSDSSFNPTNDLINEEKSSPAFMPNPVTPVRNVLQEQSTNTIADSMPDNINAQKKESHLKYRKSKFCRNIKNNGRCRFGRNCFFAHRREELVDPRKNIKCRSFWSVGYCKFGTNCYFYHGYDKTSVGGERKTFKLNYDESEWPTLCKANSKKKIKKQ